LRNRILAIGLLGIGLLGACAESLAPPKSQTLRVGVDQAFEETGLAAALRAGFEQQTQQRVALVFDTPVNLQKALRNSQLEVLMAGTNSWVKKLEVEGLLVDSMPIAHEELVFIGPQEDKFRSHGTKDPVEFLRNVIRSNHLYLRAAKGSVESDGHERLARLNGDRPGGGSELATKLVGVPFVKEIVRRRAFGLVRRSALVLAAAEGVKPNRVYQDGKAELVLPVRFLFLHPSKVHRSGQSSFKTFLTGELVRSLVERVGVGRVGLPLYTAGLPKTGEGAIVPQVEPLH